MAKGMFDKSVFERAATDLSEWFSGAFDLAELAKGSIVSLAVTGLSRAGKTVFITSLVHNLLSALHQPYRMPFLKVVGDGRLVAARLASDKTNRATAISLYAKYRAHGGEPRELADPYHRHQRNRD